MSTELDNMEIPIIRPKWLSITTEPVTHMEESFDGEYLAAALADGHIRQIETASGETLFETNAHAMGVLAISLNEAHLLATTGDKCYPGKHPKNNFHRKPSGDIFRGKLSAAF